MTDEEQIVAEYERMCQAMVDQDFDTIREIRGEDATVRHMSGRVQTLDEWFADMADGQLVYFGIELEDVQVEVTGDTATLSCVSVIDAHAYGPRSTWRVPGGAQFERVDGTWRRAIARLPCARPALLHDRAPRPIAPDPPAYSLDLGEEPSNENAGGSHCAAPPGGLARQGAPIARKCLARNCP